jgi:hypothetical protein
MNLFLLQQSTTSTKNHKLATMQYFIITLLALSATVLAIPAGHAEVSKLLEP